MRNELTGVQQKCYLGCKLVDFSKSVRDCQLRFARCLPQMLALPKALTTASPLRSFSICQRPQASLGRLQMKNAPPTSLERRL